MVSRRKVLSGILLTSLAGCSGDQRNCDIPELNLPLSSWPLPRYGPANSGSVQTRKYTNGKLSQVSWKVRVDPTEYELTTVADDERVFCADGDHTLKSFNIQSGQLKWQYVLPNNRILTGGPVLSSDVCYILSGEKGASNRMNRQLIAINSDTGNTLWRIDIPGAVALRLSPNGFLYITKYIGDSEPAIIALSARDGSECWRFIPTNRGLLDELIGASIETGEPHRYPRIPCEVNDRVYVPVVNYNGTEPDGGAVVEINNQTGNKIRETVLPKTPQKMVTATRESLILETGSNNSEIQTIDLETFSAARSFNIRSKPPYYSDIAATESGYCFAGRDSLFFIGTDGSVQWQKQVASGPPTIIGNQIFQINTTTGSLQRRTTTFGDLRNEIKLGAEQWSIPTVTAGPQSVFVRSSTHMYAIEQ